MATLPTIAAATNRPLQSGVARQWPESGEHGPAWSPRRALPAQWTVSKPEGGRVRALREQ
jgi:hypothetical protein